ncbi:MAG: hypothetical protein UHD64_09810 [Bacteroidales bacterium]|nr:hypothetical protein [Bacteroidales bacterium]
MKMVEQFKENKKVMTIKMEQAYKMADAAADEFIDFIKSLVKDASEEDLKEFLNANDDMLEFEDKLAVVAAWTEAHENVGGIAIIGIGK